MPDPIPFLMTSSGWRAVPVHRSSRDEAVPEAILKEVVLIITTAKLLYENPLFKEAIMISYKWNLSPDQHFDKEVLFEFQRALLAAGVYFDLTQSEETTQLTISVPDENPGNKPGQKPLSTPADPEDAEPECSYRQKGRPLVVPKNDLTIARIQHMRFMGVSVDTIAGKIGISKRTFYRRWKQIQWKHLDPETPFSQWI